MNRLIAYCGLDCEACEARLATLNGDEALRLSQDLARESVMRIYNMDARTADSYFRDLWLVVFSFATLIVTDDCPYTDEEMSAVLTEVSLSVCKAYKEIPGLPEGRFDKDALFRELVQRRGAETEEGR